MALPQDTDTLTFFVNGKKVTEANADPAVMLLPYLRKRLKLTGAKYGCGGGGCGSCTVMISSTHPVSKKILHYSANACLVPICSLHGAAVTTVEGIGSTTTRLHPVQERIAKAHGSQCGFCTPGMVMSMYSLLRNHPEPTMEQIYDTLGGNLCRCTGYRPILDGCKTFCKEENCCKNQGNVCNGPEKDCPQETGISSSLFNKEEFLPLDPSQEFIFPPELILMAEKQKSKKLVFQGENMKWITPISLDELLQLRVQYPQAPLIVGNTIIGPSMNFKGALYPVLISIARIEDLNIVKHTKDGLLVGASCSLSILKDALSDAVSQFPEEKTKTFCALLQQLKILAGQQIRNVASIGGHIISKSSISDLNPVLAASNATLNLLSKGGARQIPCNEAFFESQEQASGLLPDEVLVSVLIPYSQKREFVSVFRQAQRQANSSPIVVAGMRVLFHEDKDIIQEANLFFGGVGSTTMCAKRTREGIIGRQWDEEMLSEACRLVLDEVTLPPSAPGGMVEYRRTLTISFLFKFFQQVLQGLRSESLVQNGGISNCTSELRRNGPTRTDIQSCKPRYIQRIQEVTTDQPQQDTIGRPIMLSSALQQASGEAVYCDDMTPLEGELFLALVTSTRAHAKLVSLDLTEALSMPGVWDIVSAKDIPETNNFMYYDWPEQLFADVTVNCVGHIVCAIVADTPEHAKKAGRKVKIVYEDLEPILTIEDAIKHKSFYQPEMKINHGNADEAFKTADHILEGEVHIGGQEHFYMETQSIRVIPSKDSQEMVIYAASQDPSYIQGLVAATLGIPSNRVSCHVKRIGGAFGGKITKTAFISAIAAVAARKTKQPIRCILERGEDMLITGGRHPYLGRYKVGYNKDGRIVGADITFYSNGGCSVTESIFVMEISVLQMDNAYNIPNLRCHGIVCKTNLPANVSFRGFGFPQSTWVTESWIEEVAVRCKMAPEKVRELNMYRGVIVTPYKQEFDTSSLLNCWNECRESASYQERRDKITEYNKKNYWTKRGISLIP